MLNLFYWLVLFPFIAAFIIGFMGQELFYLVKSKKEPTDDSAPTPAES